MFEKFIVKKASLLGLIFFVLFGMVLRFTVLGSGFHFDENLIIEAAMRIRFFSQMDPKFYSYNGLTMYIPRLAAILIASITGDGSWLTNVRKMTVLARIVTALLSTMTLVVVYQTGTLLKSRLTGFYAMVLLVAIPLIINSVQFAKSEGYLLFFFSLMLYASLKYYKHPSRKSLILTAVVSGLAIGVKQTGFLFLLIAYACMIMVKKRNLSRKLLDVGIFTLICGLVVLVTMPYLLTSFAAVKEESRIVAEYVRGTRLAGWTMQYRDAGLGTVFVNMFFGFGPAIFLSGIVAMLYALSRNMRKRQPYLVILALWSIFYVLLHATMFLKYPRYLLPLIIPLSLMVAYMMVDILIWSRRFGTICALSILYVTFFYGLLYLTMFFLPDPQILASRWIYQNVPSGSVIVREDWNNQLPMSLENQSSDQYRFVSIDTLAEPDTVEKVNGFKKTLVGAQYFVMAVQRIKQTVKQQRKYYPYSAKFYDDLDKGQLGYRIVATFTGYPSLFGREFGWLYGMDKSPTAFVHRKVVIYRKI